MSVQNILHVVVSDPRAEILTSKGVDALRITVAHGIPCRARRCGCHAGSPDSYIVSAECTQLTSVIRMLHMAVKTSAVAGTLFAALERIRHGTASMACTVELV